MLAQCGLAWPVRGQLRLGSTTIGVYGTSKFRNTRLAARVASQYAAGGAGSAPSPLPPRQVAPPSLGPQQQQQPGFRQPYQQAAYGAGQQQGYQAPAQQQQPAQPQQRQPGQRSPVPPRRRVGAAMPPQQMQQAAASGGALPQRLAAGVAWVAAPVQQAAALEAEATPTSVQRLQGQYASDMVLPRSLLMSKEVITRTSAKRLGYVNELWVDPASLAVASLYLRASPSNILAPSCCHIMLASMRQISDVVLVHDERALSDPPADASLGYCRLVGAQVLTQSGQELGRVRDYLFDPDNGAVSTIKYDLLGLPWLPQQLLSCYSISWEDVVALGPTKIIVRAGTETRALKENDGIADTGVSVLADLLVGPADADGGARDGGGGQLGQRGTAPGAAPSTGQFSEAHRASPEYRTWYQQYGRQYEAAYGLVMPPPLDPPGAAPPQQRTQRSAPPPRALPPPQSTPFTQAVQQQQQQQQYQQYQQQPQYQQVLQQQRQAVPAGSGSGGAGWAAPPPPQQPQQFAFPPQQQGAPQGGPYRQAAPPQPQAQQYRPGPAGPGQRPMQQQGGQPPQTQRGPGPQGGQQAAPLPQNGIPIIDRTPPPPYRRRDFDGNYGPPPPAGQARQAQQQGPVQQRQQAAGAARPGGAQALGRPPPTLQPRPPLQQEQQRAPVVEPDAVIPGGLQPPGAGGSAGGTTRVAEYRQL